MTATLRRRLDNVALRAQARLEGEWVDRMLPWIAASLLFLVLAALALAKARSLEGTIDLSIYNQAAWLIREGREPLITIGSDGPTNLLAHQAAFLFYPMLAITYVVPIVPALLMLQSAALALGVVPLWRVSRRFVNLRVGAATVLLAVYALYPTLHNLNLDGFHPEVVAVPGLIAAFYFAFSRPTDAGPQSESGRSIDVGFMAKFGMNAIPARRWWLFGLCCVVVVASRADLAIAVAGLGAFMAFEGHRRAGFITLVLSLAWLLVAGLVLAPAFGDGTFPYLTAFASFGHTPGSVVWGMITHPAEVLGRLVDEQNFRLLITLLAPVIFLPLLAPRFLLPVIPLEILYLVSDVPSESRFGAQTVAITAFVFIATAFALGRIGRMGIAQVTVDKRVLGALLLAGSLFFVGDAASSPYREPWNWGGQDRVDAARHDAADIVGREASVWTTSSMLQLLAERTEVHMIVREEGLDASSIPDDTEVVVLDGADTAGWPLGELARLRRVLAADGFVAAFDERGVVVLVRQTVPGPGPGLGSESGPQSG